MNRRRAYIQRILREVEQESLVDNIQVEVVLPDHVFERLTISLEADRWLPLDNKYVYRIDPPKPEHKQRRHIHIAPKQQANSSAKAKQVSWNDDGSRHDRGSFNEKLGSIKVIREFAIKKLGLPTTGSLESDGSETILLGRLDVTERRPSYYLVEWQDAP